MREKFIEWLRQLLIRTILPLRKRREEFLSKFRFSIVFRIGFHYLQAFMMYGFMFLMAFVVLFIYSECRARMEQAGAYMESLRGQEEIDTRHLKGYFDGLGATVQILEEPMGQIVYDNTGEEVQRKYYFKIVSYVWNEIR